MYFENPFTEIVIHVKSFHINNYNKQSFKKRLTDYYSAKIVKYCNREKAISLKKKVENPINLAHIISIIFKD